MKKYTICYLSQDFFDKYDSVNYPEIEHKQSRPYLSLLIKIDGVNYAIPFRTNLKHNAGYKFKNTNRLTSSTTGLDFSKCVIIASQSFIASGATIDNKEYVELDRNINIIIKRFTTYVNNYKKIASSNKTWPNKYLYKYSTLKYFHSELGID